MTLLKLEKNNMSKFFVPKDKPRYEKVIKVFRRGVG